MKHLTLIALASTLALGSLTACQTTTSTSNMNANSTASIQTIPMNNDVLQSYKWELIDATTSNGNKIDSLFYDNNKTLALNFLESSNGSIVSLENTCNHISAPYSVTGDTVKLGSIMSTMKACPDTEAAFDAAAVQSIMGKYTLSQSSKGNLVLVITNDNQVAHYKAVSKTK